MKKVLPLVLLFFGAVVYAQSDITITQKNCIPKKGFHLRLQRVVNDSRCPENVNCIWAGEVSVIVEVYNDKKLIEEKTIVFNSKNSEENKLWFSNYYQKTIKTIIVLPYPKEGILVKAKKYYLKISF